MDGLDLEQVRVLCAEFRDNDLTEDQLYEELVALGMDPDLANTTVAVAADPFDDEQEV